MSRRGATPGAQIARANWRPRPPSTSARPTAPGGAARAKAAVEAWDKAHPKPDVTLSQVADHIDHIRQVAGVDHVGLGSDFDGIPESTEGLEGVDRYPALLAELMRRGWSDEDIAKL